MQVLVVADDLYGGVPDVLGGKLASTVNECQHDIHVPAEVWEESANPDLLLTLRPLTLNLPAPDCIPSEICRRFADMTEKTMLLPARYCSLS